MSFGIDINNPRVQNALKDLGIEEDDLLIRDFEEFSGKDVAEHIQQLRFVHHTRLRNDLVSQIKSHIKETILKERQKVNKPKLKDLSIKSSTPDPDQRLVKIKEKHKEKIEKALSLIKESFNDLKAIEKKLIEGQSMRDRLKSDTLQKLQKNSEFKEKQLENLKRIEREKRKPKKNFSSFTPRNSISKKITKRYSFSEESNDDIKQTLEKFNEKMTKSKEMHDRSIENRRQAASKLSQKAEVAFQAFKKETKEENNDVYLKFILRHKAAEDKRKEKQEKTLEKLEKNKQISLEKREKAGIRAIEHENFLKTKAKAIETRFKIYSKILEQKQLNFTRKLEVKHECQRLKDEEILFNAERKRRIMKYKRDKILEKQLSDSARIEQLKQDRETERNKHLELAMKSMIEKEKLKDILITIQKSPEHAFLSKINTK